MMARVVRFAFVFLLIFVTWVGPAGSAVADEAGGSDVSGFALPVWPEATLRFVRSMTTLESHLQPLDVPSGVDLSGSASICTNSSSSYMAIVSPGSTTLPITYTWNATGQSPASRVVNALSDGNAYSWAVSGTQSVTVTAESSGVLVTDTLGVTTRDATVGITKPARDPGYRGVPQTFTATLDCAAPDPSVYYQWSTPYDSVTHSSSSSTDHATFTFNVTGTVPVTVVATTSTKKMTNTVLFGVREPPAVIDVTGPTYIPKSVSQSFTAVVSPSLVSTDSVFFNWVYVEAGTVYTETHFGHTFEDSFNHAWSTAGATVLTVTVDNLAEESREMLPGVHPLNVGVPLSSADVVGASIAHVGAVVPFTVTLAPVNGSTPITYTWEVDGQPTVIHSSRTSLSDSVLMTWNVTGTKGITVTAASGWGSVSDSMQVVLTVPPSAIALSGPLYPRVGDLATYNVDVAPVSTTVPITYDWTAAEQGPIEHVSGLTSDSVSYAWSTTGTKPLTVTAFSSGVTVTRLASAQVGYAPTSLGLSGPDSVFLGRSYTLGASVLPITATGPITFVWEATGQAPRTQVGSAVTDLQSFTWNVSGTLVVTVTATSAWGVVSNTMSITTKVAPTSVAVAGPSIALVGQSDTYTASVAPVSVTLPITYTWSDSDGVVVSRTVGSNVDQISWGWTSPGSKVLTVTATVSDATVSKSYAVSAGVAPVGAIVSSLSDGYVGRPYTFTANVSPISATGPITYVWTATGQMPITRTSSYTTVDAVSFTWSQTGTKLITMTASSPFGTAAATADISLAVAASSVSLSGVSSGAISTTHTLTAAVVPLTSTFPLTYTWTVDGVDVISRCISALTDTLDVGWDSVGQKQVTVTVESPGLATHPVVTAAKTIAIGYPPQSVEVSGPASGYAGQSYTVTALISPFSATTPVSFTWRVGSSPPITRSVNSLEDAIAVASWQTGTLPITVTVNAYGATVTDTLSMLVVVPPYTVTVAGPTEAVALRVYTYTASVLPISTTLPLTYTWFADGVEIASHSRLSLQDTITHEWQSEGDKIIEVRAERGNARIGALMSTHVQVAPSVVTIQGQSVVSLGKSASYLAMVSPVTTSLPITFVWSATDQSGRTAVVTGTSSTAEFTWTSYGLKRLRVDAVNSSAITASAEMTVSVQSYKVYVPMVGKETVPYDGQWRSDTSESFLVTGNGSYMRDFSVQVDIPNCGPFWVTIPATDVPITQGAFAFTFGDQSGQFEGTGAFNSATTASGTDRISNLSIEGCNGTFSSGVWQWTARWESGQMARAAGSVTLGERVSSNNPTIIVRRVISSDRVNGSSIRLHKN